MMVPILTANVTLVMAFAAPDTIRIEQQIVPGKRITPSVTTAYRPAEGQRFVVNSEHQLPDDMVVQGDTVTLRVTGSASDKLADASWQITKACGSPALKTGSDPLAARFLADGYGENVITFRATVDGQPVSVDTTIFVEFSTHNMLISGDPVALPDDYEQNPLIKPPTLPVTNHRESCTARNPHTGRLVTMWQVKFEVGPDDGPMGIGLMQSDDHGITWTNRRYLYVEYPNNCGWGTLGWNPRGNHGNGEFLAFACSHVRSENNRLMLFHSRDNGEHFKHIGDYQQNLAKQFDRENSLLTYFGVNRIIATQKGTLVAPMVSQYFVRSIWSDDNGQTWHAANIDDSFPKGNENAIVETIDGARLILFARPHESKPAHNHRFESTDGGKTWKSVGRSVLPTAIVNLGLGRMDEPGAPYHGYIMQACAATRSGPHKGRQRTVLSINDDPSGVAPDHWAMRLLWDARANYSDVLYLPEDKSIFVSIETIQPGGPSQHGYEAIRCFKLTYRYWQTLPKYPLANEQGK